MLHKHKSPPLKKEVDLSIHKMFKDIRDHCGSILADNVNRLIDIHSKVGEYGFTEENRLEYNDLDSSVFYINSGKTEERILCHQGQNVHFLYNINTLLERVLIYEYRHDAMEYIRENNVSLESISMSEAIFMTDNLSSDIESESPSSGYLSLRSLKKNKFKGKYGDSRDPGFLIKVDFSVEIGCPYLFARSMGEIEFMERAIDEHEKNTGENGII